MRKILKIGMIILTSIALVAVLLLFFILEPNFKIVGWANMEQGKLIFKEKTITILDNEQNKIPGFYENNKIYVPISKIPKNTINAFISIEDKRFYKHSGVDILRIMGAAKANILAGSFKEGGSTITQQLAKNTHLNNTKTIKRKIQEIRIARDIERKYSKEEILEMYFNMLYFGNNIYGIGTAAKLFFNKGVDEININESAILASIINNPLKYSPNEDNNDALLNRRNIVLKKMLKNKKITEYEYNDARMKKICILKPSNIGNQYINGVIKEACQCLKIKENELLEKELIIGTNFDLNKQKRIEQIYGQCDTKSNIMSHILLINNSNGSIINDYSINSQNLSYTKRQPGSTIKPILSYAPALEKKLIYTSSIILDDKTSFQNYSPSNYKNKYYGFVSIKDSLKFSLNIPAVKLMELSGIEYSKSLAKKCGINFDKEDTSLALALGGMHTGVTLQELANSYQLFANGGKYIKSSYIKYIKDKRGRIIFENKLNNSNEVISDSTCFLITDMLIECAKTGTAKKLSTLNNVAAKTGTVGIGNKNSDAYCIAYTPDYTIAVWFGNKNNKLDNFISGGGYPTLVAKNVIEELKLNTKAFYQPATIAALDIDSRELENNHKIVLADDCMPLRYKRKEFFALDNLPKYYSYFNQDIFLDEFNDIDMDNFQIITENSWNTSSLLAK